jgi:hypothetical protein
MSILTFTRGTKMKALLTAALMTIATVSFAAEPAKKDAKAAPAAEQNCVKKDKDGKCPPAPKGDKPTPKAPAKKEEAKK